MSAHVLLNLSNELWKKDQTRGLQSILLLFTNNFDKFNSTGARILDFISYLAVKSMHIKNK